jgi:predicted  nucleic acid-binding Zn-ribbon protein
MGESGTANSLESALKALRTELGELREEQRALAKSVEDLAQTFRALATHLGIAAEPYSPSGRAGKGKEIPGFA